LRSVAIWSEEIARYETDLNELAEADCGIVYRVAKNNIFWHLSVRAEPPAGRD
jgi:hypothetical protein